MSLDIDSLVEASQAANNKTGEHDLWRAVVNLQRWYFVTLGDGENAEPIYGAIDGHPYLVAFTDEERAEIYASHVRERKSEAVAVVHMETPEAIEYCRVLREHEVAGVHMNLGKHGFSAPMVEVIDRFGKYRN